MSKLTQQTTQIVLPRYLSGKTVKAWRGEKKMSADNLAQRLGCSRSYIKHIEGGSLAASQKFVAKFNALRAELNGHEPEPEPVRLRTVKSTFELPKSFEILAARGPLQRLSQMVYSGHAQSKDAREHILSPTRTAPNAQAERQAMSPTIHKEYMRVGYEFAIAFGVASLPFSLLAGGVAYFVDSKTALPVLTLALFTCVSIIALALLFSLSGAHWILTEQVSADLWDREARREMLKSAGIVQQNINTGSGTIKPKINAPRIKVMGKEISWGQVNQVSQSISEPRRIEIPREDVLWMLEQFLKKHSKRPFISEELPYSRLRAYPDLYNELIRVLVEGQAIIGRNDRVAGRLVVKDVDALTQIVDRAHPNGVVLELPAATGLWLD